MSQKEMYAAVYEKAIKLYKERGIST